MMVPSRIVNKSPSLSLSPSTSLRVFPFIPPVPPYSRPLSLLSSTPPSSPLAPLCPSH